MTAGSRCCLAPLLLAVMLPQPAGDSTASRTRVPPPHAWPDGGFLPLTPERVAALPVAEQAPWRAYLAASAERARALPPVAPGPEGPPAPTSAPPLGGRHTSGLEPTQGAGADWYASDEARLRADRVVEWQSPAGAWTKGIDYTRPRNGGLARADLWSRGTLDNEATTAELRFLARVIAASEPARSRCWQASFLRGLAYLFAAQYPNGGFPQVYPLAGGYHDAITYNDSAMVRALALLRDVARREPEYAFVPEAQRAEAAERLRRGIACILRTQIRTPDGRRTVWCQQHDALTGLPCAARNFEPIAASALESASICEFLMSLPDQTPALQGAIDDAVAWFERVALRGVEWQRTNTVASGLVESPAAAPIWARLYEIGTDRPLFGDRDRTIHYTVTELSSERRLGYGWYGDWPGNVVAARRR